METLSSGTPLSFLRKHKAHPFARLLIVPTRYVQGILTPYYNRIRRPFARVWSQALNSGDLLEDTMRISSHWNTVFHLQGKTYGATRPHTSDRSHVITAFDQSVAFRERTVLELGHLEGGNTKQMLELGAKHVTGIESHPEAFLKSLLAQNALSLSNADFVFGDFNSILAHIWPASRQFDVCLACGVLYHMPNPIVTIELITQRAPIIHVWTQVASTTSPKGPWVELKDETGRVYRGRRKYYTLGAHLGGIQNSAIWLSKDDLLRSFTDRGFAISDLEITTNRNGTAVRFTALRN